MSSTWLKIGIKPNPSPNNDTESKGLNSSFASNSKFRKNSETKDLLITPKYSSSRQKSLTRLLNRGSHDQTPKNSIEKGKVSANNSFVQTNSRVRDIGSSNIRSINNIPPKPSSAIVLNKNQMMNKIANPSGFDTKRNFKQVCVKVKKLQEDVKQLVQNCIKTIKQISKFLTSKICELKDFYECKINTYELQLKESCQTINVLKEKILNTQRFSKKSIIQTYNNMNDSDDLKYSIASRGIVQNEIQIVRIESEIEHNIIMNNNKNGEQIYGNIMNMVEMMQKILQDKVDNDIIGI